MKNLFPLGACVALFMGFIVGCQDSVVDTAQSADPYAAYAVDMAAMTDFSEMPSVDDALFSVDGDDPRDSSDGGHHGGGRDSIDNHGGRDSIDNHGGRDTANHGGGHPGGRDSANRVDNHGRGSHHGNGLAWGRLENRSYARILNRLDLTADQTTAIQLCFTDFRACAQSGSEAYRTARQEKHDALEAATEQVKADLEAGTITTDEARTAIRALLTTYRTEVEALNTTFKASVQSCQDALDTCIEGHLTADQLVIWNRLHG